MKQKQSLSSHDPEKQAQKPSINKGPRLELKNLKAHILTPVSFDTGKPLQERLLHRLQGKGTLRKGNTETNIQTLIDFGPQGYQKERTTLRQSVGIGGLEALIQTKNQKNMERQFQWGVNYAHKVSATEREIGLLTQKGESLIVRSRINTKFGKNQQGQFLNRIEFDIQSGSYAGMARLSYELFEYIAPFVRTTYKGTIHGDIALRPSVGIKMSIQ